MIALTAAEAGRALGRAPLAAPVSGVSIDSRSLRPGDLFVALSGERFDGHDFVEAALAAGAAGAVIRRGATVARAAGGGPLLPETLGFCYEVDDTLEALGALAREVRRKSGVLVFAVTGSAGKTSTKDLLTAMVGRVRRVTATRANENNEVGVPMTLLAIGPDTEAVIVEMGMRGRGQIAALARVAEPDVGVITNIHPVHLELLGTLEGIAEAKAELAQGLTADGAVAVPAECDVLQPFLVRCLCRVVTHGVDVTRGCADVTGSLEEQVRGSGHALRLAWPGGEARVETPYLPRHALANVVAAAAACYAAGLPVGECAQGVREMQITGGRGEVIDLPGLCVIDDTYNANPAAVRAALDNLARVAAERGGRPVAVLGDMLELGAESERYHVEVGAYAAAVGVRALWGVGPRAKAVVEGFEAAQQGGVASGSDWAGGHVGSAAETDGVMMGLRTGDVVLFKASRGVHLESMMRRVVEAAQAGRWAGPAGRGPNAGRETEEKG